MIKAYLAFFLMGGLLLASYIIPTFPAHLAFNRSASLPLGFYLSVPVKAAELHRNDIACFTWESPAWARGRYLPEGSLVCKHVMAVEGDVVTRKSDGVYLTPRTGDAPIFAGAVRETDSAGRAVQAWPQERYMVEDNSFYMGTPVARGLDSRYLGPVPGERIRYRITPLWTWN